MGLRLSEMDHPSRSRTSPPDRWWLGLRHRGNQYHPSLACESLWENHYSQQGVAVASTAVGRMADRARHVELQV